MLPKFLALPIFSSDCLSSVAYATEEVVLVLALAGAAGFGLILPISVAIAALMVIVITSYRQTVRAYPQGGGAFLVAHDNLGLRPAMVAAASLLTDYVLTVAVSVSAGVAAITSAAPATIPYRVPDRARLPGAAHRGQPARGPRVGGPVRRPHLRLRRDRGDHPGHRPDPLRRRRLPGGALLRRRNWPRRWPGSRSS